MNEINHILAIKDSPELRVLITGDFNFHFIEWKRNEMSECTWRKKKTVHGTINQQKYFEKLIEVIDKHPLVQMKEQPTRENNTLDLMFPNNPKIKTQLYYQKQ